MLEAAGRNGEPPEHASVRVDVYRKRLQDVDNLWGSVKPILDALKRTGWIKDDDRESITLHVEEHKAKEQKTTITVEEVSHEGQQETSKGES